MDIVHHNSHPWYKHLMVCIDNELSQYALLKTSLLLSRLPPLFHIAIISLTT